jgi:hypothetical protein
MKCVACGRTLPKPAATGRPLAHCGATCRKRAQRLRAAENGQLRALEERRARGKGTSEPVEGLAARLGITLPGR